MCFGLFWARHLPFGTSSVTFGCFQQFLGIVWDSLEHVNSFEHIFDMGALTRESFQDALGRFWHVFSLIDWIMWGMEYIQQKRDMTICEIMK